MKSFCLDRQLILILLIILNVYSYQILLKRFNSGLILKNKFRFMKLKAISSSIEKPIASTKLSNMKPKRKKIVKVVELELKPSENIQVNTIPSSTSLLENPSVTPIPNEIKFTVFGDPIPLQRHRVSRGFVYNPSSDDQKNFLKLSQSNFPTLPLEGPLQVNLVFYFKRPTIHYRSGKNSHILKSSAVSYFHIQRKGTIFHNCILFLTNLFWL